MHKILPSYLVIFIFFSEVGLGIVHSKLTEEPRPYEEIYSEIGYKTIEEAIKDFQKHNKQELMLPVRVPPINFTHYFGRFNSSQNSIEIKFVNEITPKNHFKIEVRPIKNKISFEEQRNLGIIQLERGNEAQFLKVSGFKVLVFERNCWQYVCSVDERVSDKINLNEMVKIANSID